MNNLKILFGLLVILFGSQPIWASSYQLTGKVISPYRNQPVADALVTSSESDKSIKTNSDGTFTLEVTDQSGTIEVWAPGYYNQTVLVQQTDMLIVMVPINKLNYNEDLQIPFGGLSSNNKPTAMAGINKANFSKGGLFINNVLHDAIPGLQLIDGSGMPGEGSYMNSRGINSVIGSTSPLIIIDGVPYMPDYSESPVIGGFCSNIFGAFSASDIKNITYLKGADAALYGSLASNGILMIETDNASDLETRVSFYAQYGMANTKNTMPLLNPADIKSYIGDVAQTYFNDMADIVKEFPFLIDNPDYYYNFLYNNNTNWQDLIMDPAFVTENILKIKGGDAIAKYDLSFGYLNQEGVINNSGLQRYNMRLNSNLNISKQINMFASTSLAYLSNKLHEQGILPETNPLIASMAKSPLLSAYKKDEYNNLLPDYATIRDEDGNVKIGDEVSNPLALVNSVGITSEGSDVLMNGGINYLINNNLKLTGMVGLYNNYNRSEVFIPGKSNGAIMPLKDGLADNTVREGIREAFNMYYSINATFNKTLHGVHQLSALAGVQMMTIRREFDAGEGRNTSSDFYKTLDNVSAIGRNFYGYIYKSNWMNGFAKARYTYNMKYSAGLTLSIDGASSTGDAHSQMGLFPGVNMAAYLHNLPALAGNSIINTLTVRGEYFMTGNSNFSANLSDYYYRNQVFRELSGIVRANIPNTNLKWENNSTLNAGIDFSGFKHRLDITVDVYSKKATDVILAKSISPAFGIDFTYDNMATLLNTGFEAGFQATIVNNPAFDFVVGGSISTNKNKVLSLGGEGDKIISFQDGTALITREGEQVYCFYGYQTNGVYSTTEEAEADGLTDFAGRPFKAGDVRFVNVDDSDMRIDDNDRVIIGKPSPDFFGRLYASLRFKRLALLASFSYSYGNDAYNGLRRQFETMDNFGNQLVSAKRRWQTEGQLTDVPRAIYNDPMGNGRFSDRWIEDASYIKLKELTLSYELQKGDLGIFQGGSVYLSGENLWTFTEYLGLDPEFSYSYVPYKQGLDFAKLPLVRTVKFGFKLQF